MRARPLAAPLSTCLFVALALGLGACSVFRDNVRELGRAATQGVGQELPNLKGPLKQTLREALLGADLLDGPAVKHPDPAGQSGQIGQSSPHGEQTAASLRKMRFAYLK